MGNVEVNDFHSSSDTNGVIKINDNEINGACGTCGRRRKMHTRVSVEKLREKRNLEDARIERSLF